MALLAASAIAAHLGKIGYRSIEQRPCGELNYVGPRGGPRYVVYIRLEGLIPMGTYFDMVLHSIKPRTDRLSDEELAGLAIGVIQFDDVRELPGFAHIADLVSREDEDRGYPIVGSDEWMRALSVLAIRRLLGP